MQSEHAPVLRFNVAAFILCALAMLAFGRQMFERKRDAAEHARAAQVAEEQRRTAAADLRAQIEELRALHEKMDAEIEARRGCTIGSHSSESELRRMRAKLVDLRAHRAELFSRTY